MAALERLGVKLLLQLERVELAAGRVAVVASEALLLAEVLLYEVRRLAREVHVRRRVLGQLVQLHPAKSARSRRGERTCARRHARRSRGARR